MLIPQELQLSHFSVKIYRSIIQTKDFELSEKGNCLFHTKF